MDKEYDIYTLGLGKRQFEDFAALIPEGITRVVDIRNYTANSYQPQFNSGNLRSSLEEMGISYTHVKGLSGVSKERKHFAEGKNGTVDFSKLTGEKSVQQAFLDLAVAAESGEKILVVSGLTNPLKSERSMFFGQVLERSTQLTVGHIDTDSNGNVRVRSQEDAVKGILWQYDLEPGEYRKVQFQSDETFSYPPEANIRKRPAVHPDQQGDRNIVGNWNYDAAVDIQEDPVTARTRSHREIYGPSLEKNARWADLTVAFESSTNSDESRMTRRASDGRFISVHIPAHREDLLDPETVSKAADRIRKAVTKQMVKKVISQGEGILDDLGARINITGSDIAEIATKYMEAPVDEYEIQGDTSRADRKMLAKMAEAGMGLAVSGITQEDMNDFVAAVMEDVVRNPGSVEYVDEKEYAVSISEIRTNGQSGAAEAGTLAAQQLGVKASILAPNRFHYIYENETPEGVDVKDEASFKNRFKTGLRHEVTQEQEMTIAEAAEALERRMEDGFGTGLTSRQILTLHNLGFNNNDVMTMVNLADNNEIIITSPSDMLSFIENCAGYGIKSDCYTEQTIRDAMEKADMMIVEGRKNGIYLLTVKSPLYPDAFNRINEIESVFTDMDITMTPNEEGRIRAVQRKTLDKQPAILWARGDINITNGETVALLGNANSTDEALYAARNLGHGLSESDLIAVTSLQGGSQSEAISSMTEEDGRAVVLSADGIDSKGMNAELADNVVKKGGVVLSETGPGEEAPKAEKKREQKARLQKLSAFLGKTAVVIDSVSQDVALSPVSAVAYSAYGACAVVLNGLDSILKHKGNKEALDKGAAPVSLSGADIKEAVQKAARSVSDKLDELYDQAVEAEDMHREQSVIPVIRMQGEKPIVLVGPGNDNLRRALESEYGQSIIIAPLSRRQEYFDARLHQQKIAQDGTISTRQGFKGYSGTQSQVAEPYMENLYFVDGKINTLMTLPDRTPGMLSLDKRLRNKALFDRFREGAIDIQQHFQTEAGMPEHVPIHFENALHPVIKENRVDIRLGDETVASVWLSESGALKMENGKPISYDLQEHAKPWTSIFRTSLYKADEATIDSLLKELDTRLLSADSREAEERVLGTREDNEQIDKEIEEGFRDIAVDNLDVAAADISEAIAKGTMSEYVPVEENDLTATDVLIHKRIASIAETRENDIRDMQDLMATRVAGLQSFRDAALQITQAIDSYGKDGEMNDQQESFKISAQRVATALADENTDLLRLKDYVNDLARVTQDLSKTQKEILESAREAVATIEKVDDCEKQMAELKVDIDDFNNSIEKYLNISNDLKAGAVILNDDSDNENCKCLNIGGETIKLFSSVQISESQCIHALRNAIELETDDAERQKLETMESLIVKGRSRTEAMLTTRGLELTVGRVEKKQENGEKVEEAVFRNALLSGKQLEGIDDLEANMEIAKDVDLRRRKGRTDTSMGIGLTKDSDYEAAATLTQKAEEEVTRIMEEREASKEQSKTGVVNNTSKALPSEIVSEPKNGIAIMERNGLKAYIDQELNIISSFYSNVTEFGGMYGWVYNDKGVFNIVNKEGRELLPVWLSGIDTQNGVDNVYRVTQANGRQNLLDTRNLSLLGSEGFKEIYPFRQGWALFRQDDGRVNYVNSKNETFFVNGVEKGKEFDENGLMQVLDQGEVHTYRSNGEMVDLVQAHTNGIQLSKNQ